MPVFDLVCLTCELQFIDEWGTADNLKAESCPACGGPRRIVIHPVGMLAGDSWDDPGVIRQFEVKYKDRDGNERTVDLKHKLSGQEKGKLTTPWDGKKVSPKEVEAIAADACPDA